MAPTSPRSLEEQLRESEERYRLTFEFAPVGIGIVDAQRRIVRANRRFCEIVGYSAEEMLRLTLREISHPDDVSVGDQYMGRLERGESDQETYERRYIRRNGSVVWVQVTASAVRDEEGRLAYFLGVIEDITERRATASRLAFQARLLDSVRQAVVATDLEGRITFWNRFAEELYGWKAGEVVGRAVLEVIPAPRSAEEAAAIMAIMRSGRPWSGEIAVRHRSGREFIALVNDSPLFDPEGNLIGLIGVSQEITELHAARVEQATLARIGTMALGNAGLGFLFNRSVDDVRELLGVDVVEIHKEVDGRLLVVARSGFAGAGTPCPGLAEQALAGAATVLVERADGTRSGLEPDAGPGEVRGISIVMESGATRWGVLIACSFVPRQLSVPDVNFLRTLATLVGQAIERRRVEVELRLRASQQSAIAELGRLTSAFVSRASLERACELVMEVLGVEHVALLEPSSDRSMLLVVAGGMQIAPMPVEGSHAGLVFTTGATSAISETGSETTRRIPDIARSGVATAVGTGDSRRGVLCAWTVAQRRFAPADLQFLESVALVIAEAHQRDKARVELTESESRFRNVVEGTSEIIFSIGPDGAFRSLNPAFEAITGWRPDQWLGRPFADMIVEDERGAKIALFHSVLREPRHVRMQMRIRGSSSIVLVDVASSPRVVNGEVVEIYGFARDITEEHRLEGKLDQATRLSGLGRLAATVAHEFNNVLMGILPFTEMLRREAGVSERASTAIEQISRSVKRGKRITEDILRFAQPAEPAVTSLDVTAWLGSLALEARSLVGPRYEVQVDIDAGEGRLCIRADQHQMHQALVNLILNARDAMPQGGKIGIAARRERSDAHFAFGDVASPDRYAHLIVEDHGTGIGPESIGHIFEPLFTTKKTGTGLGLPVTRQVVARHDGEIFVETAVSQGTSFHLFIPLAHEAEAAVAATPKPEGRRCRRILLVEDEQAVAAGLSALLDLEGVQVDVVTTGAAVLPALARTRPDAVVLDIGLPDMEGTTVFAVLSQIYPDLPVVFSSGHGDAVKLEHLLAQPHVAFLLKPYDVDVLLQTLERVTAEKSEVGGAP